MKTPVYLILATILFAAGGCEPASDAPDRETATYVTAPFSGLDTLATNDWWNRGENPILEIEVDRDSVIAFGAYTVANGVLKLSAQLYPLYPEESRTVRLETREMADWKEIAAREVNEIGWMTTFRIEDWPTDKDVEYRLRHGDKATYTGTIRRLPEAGKAISIAALSCNSNKDRGGREAYVRNINFLDPDLVFFAGDQSYDHKEHTAAWLLFGKQFRETFRHRPMISIPDDHDIGQGNLWGEGGKKAERVQGDDGGYFHHPDYVKMVERAQTSHLPDPYDPQPIERGIGVYYTSYPLGSVDFAIIEDRKFKSGPKDKIPQQGPRPDHVNDPNYDPATVDLPGLKLLGDRQLTFLEDWAGTRPAGTTMKAVLSQTGFCNGAHIHGQPDNRLHADMDSNGWPQTGRNKALELIRRAGAVHIAGDQHLATVIQHGIEEFRDGPWHFVVPAVVNNYYSRWWWPADEKAGGEGPLHEALPWTGDYLDGFHNKITLRAYANPDTRDHGAGFGYIVFDPEAETTTFHCYPRTANLAAGDDGEFAGWPVTVE